MKTIELVPVALSSEAFAAYGDVIDVVRDDAGTMNEARFARHDSRARPVAEGGGLGIGVVRSRVATALPCEFEEVECHPLGSQAFIPRGPFSFVVVVARAGDTVAASDLQAFVATGGQGINYHPGTWHMPLIALEMRQEFIVIDRVNADGNLKVQTLDARVRLLPPATSIA